MGDLDQDAYDLVELVSDQVRRLGAHSRTKKAVTIFGHIGRQKHVSEFAGTGEDAKKIEPRKPRIQRSLVQLTVEMTISFTETAVSTIVFWAFVALRWMLKSANVHKILLSSLVASVTFNTFLYSRSAYDWWQERNAKDFMVRLGVEADNVMSKAIYLSDIDEAIANSTVQAPGSGSGNVSDCFSTFYDQVVEGKSGIAFDLAPPHSGDSVAKKSIRRFHQTREQLSVNRHDLIVALRVINSIDRELVQNEWESWLRTELHRCNQVGSLLSESDEEADSVEGQLTQSVFAEQIDEVKHWYDAYCISCRWEREHIDIDRSHGHAHADTQPLVMYGE